MDKMTMEGGVKKEFTVIITDLPVTIDLEKFISSTPLPRNRITN